MLIFIFIINHLLFAIILLYNLTVFGEIEEGRNMVQLCYCYCLYGFKKEMHS